MNPKIWGPSLWASLIYIVLNYPNNPSSTEQETYRVYLENLGGVLPCNVCKNHYQKNFPIHPPQLENATKLMAWLVELHNRCNPKSKYTREQFINRYTPNCQDKVHSNKSKHDPVKRVSRPPKKRTL